MSSLTSWNQLLAADAVLFFENVGGEWITYTPFGGITRRVWAIIDREKIVSVDRGDGQIVPAFRVKLINDPTLDGGIDPSAIKQGDKLNFLRDLNDDAPADFILPATPISQDPGIVEFIVH